MVFQRIFFTVAAPMNLQNDSEAAVLYTLYFQ